MRIEEKMTHGNVQLKLRSFNTKMQDFSRALVMKQALVFKDVAQQGCPEGKTGDMKDSIGNATHKYGIWEVSEKGLSIKVGSSHPAILIVENGACRHDIVPKKAGGVLRFRTKTGDLVFAKKVNHPGFKGKHFMKKAAFEAKRIRI